jgi:hypothetical protein
MALGSNSISMLRATNLFSRRKTNLLTMGGVAQEHKRIFSAQITTLDYF